jgi:hypothetical protein
MKSAVLLIAMLSGLCAEAVAAPIGSAGHQTAPAAPDDVFTHPVIERDLSFHGASAREALFADEDDPDPWDLNFDTLISDEEFAIAGSAGSGSLWVPTPPPFTTIAVGLSCPGIFALFRRIRKKKRSLRRRRVVRLRAIITAER